MISVVKIGGSLLGPEPSPALLAALTRRLAAGEDLCLIHGGGQELTAVLSRLGIASRFERGLRVTDRDTLEAAVMVLAGATNKRLVAALNRGLAAAGCAARAVGLCGIDGGCLYARRSDPELGYVGETAGGDPRLLRALRTAGFVPVLASIAAAADAEFALNVNADAFAAACAAQLGAARLEFLTDVPGVLDAAGRVLPAIGLEAAAALEAAGVVSAGMLPKLSACRAALAAGVGEVRIAGLGGAGTRVVAATRFAVLEEVY